MNGAFETIKRMCLAPHDNLKGLVVFVAAVFAGAHVPLLSCCTALATPRGLFGRSRPFGGRPLGRGLAAKPATLARWRVVFLLAPAGAVLLAAVSFLIDGRPGAPFRFAYGHAPTLITLFDMFGLTLLLVGIAGLVATGHNASPISRANLMAPEEFLLGWTGSKPCPKSRRAARPYRVFEKMTAP